MSRLSLLLAVVVCLGCGSAKTPEVSSSSAKPAATEPIESPNLDAKPAADLPWPAELSEAIRQRNIAEAISLVTREIESAPQQPAWYRLRGGLYHQSGTNDLAAEDFSKAIELSPREAALYNNRGFVLLSLQQFAGAKKDLDEAIRLNPEYAQAYNNRGLLLIAQRKYSEAVVQFNRAVEINPQYVDAYNNRGFSRLQLRQLETSLGDFNTVLKLRPDYVNGFNNRGLLKAWAGDYTSAIADFTHAMTLDSRNPKYYQHRREVYLKLGNVDQAQADQNKIEWLNRLADWNARLARSPEDAGMYVERANHFRKGRDDDSAARDIAAALDKSPQFAPALLLRGQMALEQKKYDQVVASCTEIIERDPVPEAFSLRGDALLAQRKYDAALADFAACRRIDPAVAEAHLLKSRELQQAGQKEAAEVELAQALALDPSVEERLR